MIETYHGLHWRPFGLQHGFFLSHYPSFTPLRLIISLTIISFAMIVNELDNLNDPEGLGV
jgi:hypothetical protein